MAQNRPSLWFWCLAALICFVMVALILADLAQPNIGVVRASLQVPIPVSQGTKAPTVKASDKLLPTALLPLTDAEKLEIRAAQWEVAKTLAHVNEAQARINQLDAILRTQQTKIQTLAQSVLERRELNANTYFLDLDTLEIVVRPAAVRVIEEKKDVVPPKKSP